MPPHNSGPTGLGGWLILIAIGLVVSPIRLVVVLLQTFVPLFTDGSWEAMMTPGTEAYQPFLGPLVLFELLGNMAFLAAHLWLLVAFFKRSRVFPKLFICVAVLSLLFVLGDTLLCSAVLPEVPAFDPDTVRELAKSIGVVLIWVPYMLVSQRVKNTFVK